MRDIFVYAECFEWDEILEVRNSGDREEKVKRRKVWALKLYTDLMFETLLHLE